MAKVAIALDLGGTKLLAALVTDTGAVLESWRSPTPSHEGAAAILDAMEAAARQALAAAAHHPGAELTGLGIASAGQVDADRGVITYASPNLPGWTGTAVGPELSGRLGLPVAVENDANAAAYGEWWVGAGRDSCNLVMLTIGTGVGGGIVVANGLSPEPRSVIGFSPTSQGATPGPHPPARLWHGANWRGGELGHMVVAAEGEPCNCGQTGCLEVYASGTAIARLAAQARPGWMPSSREVFTAADAGDAVALAVLRRSTRFLAAGIVSLTSALDPDRIVIGGGVASQPLFLPLLESALADPAVAGQRPFDAQRLRLATLGNQAGVVGATGLLLHRWPA